MLDEKKRMMLKRTNQDKPKYNYKEKFQHLVGLEAAEQAARKTETNKSYGFGKFKTFHVIFLDFEPNKYLSFKI
jgi:hypothetical protein